MCAKIHPHQESLFTDSQDVGAYTWQLADVNPQLKAYLDAKNEGVPMVDILDRSNYLIEAITELGRMSQIGVGFLTAVTSPEHRPDIDNHYGSHVTPHVAVNAERKLPRREAKVKKLVWRATGFAALRDQLVIPEESLMNAEEINGYAKHAWERFSTKFAPGPDNQPARNEYRKKLRKQRTQQRKLRKRLELPLDTYANVKKAA